MEVTLYAVWHNIYEGWLDHENCWFMEGLDKARLFTSRELAESFVIEPEVEKVHTLLIEVQGD